MSQSLWDFAVALYAHPQVAGWCLRLQDEQGADICLLLTALWLERRGVTATPQRSARLQQLATPWQREVTAPLRQLRGAWKAAAGSDDDLAGLRGQLASLELQAERLLLERLQALAETWPASVPASTDDWLSMLAPQATSRATLEQLRAAATMWLQS